MMKRFRNEEGQTLVLTALLGCILMGFMALAIDMGVSFRTQRRVQTQADSAVIAAALCATYGGQFCKAYGGTDVTSVATNAATANGMPSNATISVAPAAYGQHRSGYYEVIIKQPSAAPFVGTFAGMFTRGTAAYNPMNVGARAVAGLVPGTTCLYVLNKTADKALYVKGGGGGSKADATIYAPNCSIQVNSKAADALCSTGNSADIDAGQILIVGAQGSAGKCNGTQPNVQTGVGAADNPLANMIDPSTGCKSGNTFGFGGGASVTLSETGGVITLTNTKTSAKITVTEGTFKPVSGGASASIACFSDADVQVTTNLGSSGNEVFVFQNGLNVAGSGLITITGTIDLAGGKFQEANTSLFINGPTLDSSVQPYTGMAFISTSTADSCASSIHSMGSVPSGDGCLQLQFGSGGSPSPSGNCTAASGQPGIVGTVYAPTSVLFMQDSGGCVSVTNLIADEVWNNSALTIYNYNLAYTTSPLDVVRLVE
jgi:Flp pilus assembly protein TadG